MKTPFFSPGLGSEANAFDDIINGSDTPESTYPSAGGVLLSASVPWGGTDYELKL